MILRLTLWAAVPFAFLATACGGNSEEARAVMVKTVAVPQCAPPPVTIQTLDHELQATGIVSHASSCASNGRTYAAACSEPIEYYRLIEVSLSQVELAKTIGYKPVGEIGTVIIPRSCPTG
jgi:hypothetical protein